MFKLNEISADKLNWYYLKMKDKINCSNLSEVSKKFLTEDIIKALLTEKPEILLDIHTASPCELKNKSIIEKVFNYELYISQSKPFSYKIAEKIGINTCTYCNRNYTLTIAYTDPETNRVNDSTRISRPQFDHYFSQKDYPLLALSIYNLIPSCSICNSTIKGSSPLNKDLHLHPYISEVDINEREFKFSYDVDSLNKLSVKIKSNENSKIKRTLDFFETEEIYNAHSNFELKDLYDLRMKYSDTFLNIIESNFDGIMKKKEAYRMIFGIETKEDNHHQRPFSKFKHDIIEELKNSY
ncbi:hypothetical protein [Chryseobacterium sp. JK1]|uniref:hypothetical protein n=1 Tax=Chryseobacterium sp. JK1 TaxID=874294 RepID=UPI003D69E092